MRDRDYYLNLDYEIVVRNLSEDEGGGYFAYYKDFKGIMGDGETIEEAIKDVKSAFISYLDFALKNGEEIKEPSHLTKTRRVNITVPIYLLEKIDKYAKSLNKNRSTFLVESALKQIKKEKYGRK
jgi:predicted RNase H-like HicB family nuclease